MILEALTGREKPFGRNSPTHSSSTTSLMANRTLGSMRICPLTACAHD